MAHSMNASHKPVHEDIRSYWLIFAGSFHFNTDAPERMDIIAGACRIKLKGETEWRRIEGGSFFEVPGKSAFDIAVEGSPAEYVCSYL